MVQPIAIAVVVKNNRFLIRRRAMEQSLSGFWEFPGGKVELGESPAQAAVRECVEETSLRVEVIGEYPSQLQRYEHGEVLLHFFCCIPLDPGEKPAGGFCWVDRADLAMYAFPEGNRSLLALLLNSPMPD